MNVASLYAWIDELALKTILPPEELSLLIQTLFLPGSDTTYLFAQADRVRRLNRSDETLIRGIVEIGNYCRNGCLYCGINKFNTHVERFRLKEEQILRCCQNGYEQGYGTFVLQGGEDPFFTDELLTDLIGTIQDRWPQVTITLSLGERGRDSYERLFQAGARRYLLRHETASRSLYETLHPNMSFENRIASLYHLKEIGYETGAGFLIGLPGQGVSDYVKDILFLHRLQPQMVGMGPFIPQKETLLAAHRPGDVREVLILLALVRLVLPQANIPATTALGTLDPSARQQALFGGANVLMDNLSPEENRIKYSLYDGKR